MHELQLMTMCCDIDDFCKRLEPIFHRHLLQSGQGCRARRDRLNTVSLETSVPFSREERHKVVFQAHMQQSPTSQRETYVCTVEIFPI